MHLLLVVLFFWGETPFSKINHDYNAGDCLPSDTYTIEEPDANWYYAKALCACQTQEFDVASANFEKAHALGFSEVPALFWFHRAVAESHLGNEEEAIRYLQQSVRFGFHNKRALESTDFSSIEQHPEYLAISNYLEPSFNTWTGLFLFVSLQAVFMTFVLLNLKGNKRANRQLALLLMTFAIMIFSYVLYWTHYNSYFPYLNYLYIPLTYLTGPLFYSYVRSIGSARPPAYGWIHYVVPVVMMIFLSPVIHAQWSMLQVSGLWPSVGVYVAIATSPILQVVYLGFYVFLCFMEYYHTQEDQYHLQNWFKYLLLGFSGYYISLVTYYVLVNFSFFNPQWDYAISFAMSFFVFSVSFLGYVHPQVLAGKSLDSLVVPFKYRKSGLTPAAEKALKNTLLMLMEEKELYVRPLSLKDLALYANASRHDVSLVINKHFDVNYFEFINSYRLRKVKQLLLDSNHAKTPVIQLAYEAGFTNKVTFNKVFKKETGCTPMTFRATKGAIRRDNKLRS